MKELLPTDSNNSSLAFDVFYYYSYYLILSGASTLEVDKNTALSIAFKKLQSRASRIDDLETKRSFLGKHFWNSALFDAAKENRLI